MKRLDKKDAARLAELQSELSDAKEKLESAFENMNEAITNMEEFRGEVHSKMTDYFEDRSEKWQEGDAGQQYGEWMGRWEDSLDTLDEIELDAYDNALEYPVEPE
jgi:uncharacterized protein YukE